jgi:hypothetical protein
MSSERENASIDNLPELIDLSIFSDVTPFSFLRPSDIE